MNLLCLSELLRECIAGTEFEAKTYFAGGCVRDYLMKGALSEDSSPDVDVCIELHNGTMLLAELLVKEHNAIILNSYPEFGTLKLSIHGISLELVTTRREAYRYPSRYPKVSFGTLREDVMRRDFSINALLMDVCSMELFDYSGFGKMDLDMGIIRCIGNPAKRFREDPLRLLRALRFALRFGFAHDDATYLAMKHCTHELNRLSDRLIVSEINKILQCNSKDMLKLAIEQLNWSEQLSGYL
jgi:tRNA nucleotidyltransferase/poly(A) polymerase